VSLGIANCLKVGIDVTGETASSMFSGEETSIKSNRYSSKMKIINLGGVRHTPRVQDKVDKAAEKMGSSKEK
jgi:hypothetical protein